MLFQNSCCWPVSHCTAVTRRSSLYVVLKGEEDCVAALVVNVFDTAASNTVAVDIKLPATAQTDMSLKMALDAGDMVRV